MRRLILLAGLTVMCGSAVLATTAAADSVPRNAAQCSTALSAFFAKTKGKTQPPSVASAEWCEILIARKNAKLGMPVRNTVLTSSSGAHAAASAKAHSWDLNNGLVSHLDPGTPVPGDQTSLQNLVNQQVDARIRGAGYCAGGRSYSDAEITFATSASKKDAVLGAKRFWKTDPPHRAVLLDPKWTDIGVSVVTPSAFPGTTSGYTFVVDLGTCTL